MRKSRKLVSKWTVSAMLLTCVMGLVYLRQAQLNNSPFTGLEAAIHHQGVNHNTKISSVQLINIAELHKLQRADDFLPYFDSLPSMANLTVGEAFGTCNYNDEETGHFQFDWDKWWKVELRPENETSFHRSAWQSYIQHDLKPWSNVSHLFSGAGIVIVAGADRSISRVKVLLRILRQHHNTALPVELHFWDDEVNDKQQAELTAIYGASLFFNDLSLPHQIFPTYKNVFWSNYHLKTAAIVNSRFSEILLLDSDNIPVIDPAELFSSQTYRTYGTVFWPDMMRSRPQNPMWAIMNTPCRRHEYELESGQLMVSKARYWYHLQLAAWMNTQPYFNEIVLGDKDMFRWAWHALKTEFGTPTKWLTSVGFVAEQPGDSNTKEEDVQMKYCGHSFAQHHPDHSTIKGMPGSGIAFLHGGFLKAITAPYMARMLALQDGIFSHYKHVSSVTQEDWSKIEYGVFVVPWNSAWYLNRTKNIELSKVISVDEDLDLDGIPIGKEGLERLTITDHDLEHTATCVDLQHVKAGPISDLSPEMVGMHELFKKYGGYWMVEQAIRP